MGTQRNLNMLKNYLTDVEKKEVSLILDRARERAELLGVRGVNVAGSEIVRSYIKKDEKRLVDLIALARARVMALEMRKRDRARDRERMKGLMASKLTNRLAEGLSLGNVDRRDVEAIITEARSACGK